MYQVTFSISSGYVDWFYAVESKLKNDLGSCAVMVTRSEPSRLFIAVACENHYKKRVSDVLNATLLEIYSVQAKRYYYQENLKIPMLSEEKYNILLAALIEFDSLADKEFIKESVNLESGLNIDGVYNFAFSEVKNRWKDIGDLTKENAAYLTDNEIFFELIKYMFSAITPKTESVLLTFDGDKYILFDLMRSEIIKEVSSEEELFCTLISIAPISLELKGEVIDSTVRQKLGAIFGLKPFKMSSNTLN